MRQYFMGVFVVLTVALPVYGADKEDLAVKCPESLNMETLIQFKNDENYKLKFENLEFSMDNINRHFLKLPSFLGLPSSHSKLSKANAYGVKEEDGMRICKYTLRSAWRSKWESKEKSKASGNLEEFEISAALE
jgi:hypothetical protein